MLVYRMMKRTNIIWIYTSLVTALSCCSPVRAAEPVQERLAGYNDSGVQERPAGYNDSGVQLNRMRRYLEEQQLLERLEEGRKTDQLAPQKEEQEENSDVKFTLKEIKTTASQILQEDELHKLTEAYLGREITLNDFYQCVAEINFAYQRKGYFTCKAMLLPQTIHDGVAEITLIEGKTASVTVEGAQSTRDNYIRHRIRMATGDIKNTHELNKEILRFNATNDAQLYVMLKPGSEVGTTDYIITVREPNRMATGLFIDNAGSKTSGEWREGIYWLDRSLTGNRDSLLISAQRSQGTKALAARYETPINRTGAKVGLTYSTNRVKVTEGTFEPLNVDGQSTAYTAFYTQPMQTTEKVKSEWNLEVGKQHSETDLMNGRYNWVDDDMSTVQLSASQVNYGRSSIFYQKHAYRMGKHENKSNISSNYSKYTLNMLYQKIFSHGQTFQGRFDAQLGFDDYLPGAEMFYIGGLYSVRGYKESVLGGDSGYNWSLEYGVPFDRARNINGFIFLEGGTVFGESSFQDDTIISTGFGVRANIGKKVNTSIGMGFPLIKELNGEDQDGSKVLFNMNAQF